MTAFTNFDPEEDIVEGNVAKNVTSTLFSIGSTLSAFYTSSSQTGSARAAYYRDIYDKDPGTDTTAQVQFQIAYGHYAGSGSALSTGASTGIQPTRAVYSQFRNLLIENPSPNTKFTLGDNTVVDRAVFFTLNRARFKESIDVGNWTLTMTGSKGTTAGFKLTDDSPVSTGTTENGHKVYNVISGSVGDLHRTGSGEYVNWGKIYPELGIIMLSGDRIFGTDAGLDHFNLNLGTVHGGALGLAANEQQNVLENVHESLVSFVGRADEDVSSTHYFVRAKNSRYNFTTNETFRTGSAGQLRHTSMIGDPQVFITTVGLYTDANELVAIAKLSKPLLKNFEREATIRVKLDY